LIKLGYVFKAPNVLAFIEKGGVYHEKFLEKGEYLWCLEHTWVPTFIVSGGTGGIPINMMILAQYWSFTICSIGPVLAICTGPIKLCTSVENWPSTEYRYWPRTGLVMAQY